MNHDNTKPLVFPAETHNELRDLLTETIRKGGLRLLIQAVENEVAGWIDEHAHHAWENGYRQVVRNGHAEPRTIITGVGPMEIQMPRVHDRRPEGEREKFTSKILPPYLRKTKSMEELIPWLYLKGVSSGDFNEALQALIGPDCPGFSASTVTQLASQWQEDHIRWSERDFTDKQYVYIWVAPGIGIHFNIRLEEDRQCILVLMGATADGRKELIAVQDGYRESELSWMDMLLSLKKQGLSIDPKLVIADGALGFWAACRKVWPNVTEQRCWVHKTANVLDKMPKSVQPDAKRHIHDVYMAATKKDATEAFDHFIKLYQVKYPKAVACLTKDRDELLIKYEIVRSFEKAVLC